MQKKILIVIGMALGLLFLIYVVNLLLGVLEPVVYVIGWIVLLAIIGAGVFFIVKNVIKLIKK